MKQESDGALLYKHDSKFLWKITSWVDFQTSEVVPWERMEGRRP